MFPRSIGLAVSGFGSTPYNVAVGGTDFNDLTTTSKYWSATNSTTQANAKGYIPEMTWNDTCTNSEIFPFSNLPRRPPTDLQHAEPSRITLWSVTGGSGGASNCTSSTQ